MRLTSGHARRTRCRPSAGSSASTARSTPRPRGADVDVHRGGDRPRRSTRMRVPYSRQNRTCASSRPTSREHSTRSIGPIAGDAFVSRRSARAGSRPGHRGARSPWPVATPSRQCPKRRDETPADARRVDRAAICLARLRACEVERRYLHRRRPDAGDWRRSDEPRRCRQGGGDEGRRAARRHQSRHPMRSSRFATDSMRSPRPAQPPSCSPADRCAMPKSSPPPTNTGWRWSSRDGGISGTDAADSEEPSVISSRSQLSVISISYRQRSADFRQIG